MARDPQFEQQLNDAKKLLKQLNDIRMQLGRDPIKLTDPESVKQLKSLPSDIRDARKALDEMDGSASNLYSRLKAVTSEFKNQTSETANIRKGFRGLTSIVEELKFEEAGISDLNTKQLNNLHKRAKIEKERISTSARLLINNTKDYGTSLNGLDEEISRRLRIGASQDEINNLVSESLKFHQNLSDEQKAMLQAYYDQEGAIDAIVKKTQERLDLERAIDKKVSGFTFMKDLTEGIPGLRVFSKPFQDAENAARGAVKAAKSKGVGNLGQVGQSLSAGLGSLGKSLMKSLGPALILAKVLQGISQLFFAANENMVAIQKNLGISSESAERLRKEFIGTAAASENILVNSKELITAQAALSQALGVSSIGVNELGEDFVFLTKNLGMSGDNAADLLLQFRSQDETLNDILSTTLATSNAAALQEGFFVNNQDVLRDIATVSDEIRGYYGGSAQELAKAAFQTRKLGLNLTAAQSVSESLLNFESSIAGELELELLTSKQLNFERARALAATGDIAGATQEVMKEMSQLTDEQMRSPIILEAMSKASGLNADQIIKARRITQNLNKDQKAYLESIQKTGDQERYNQTANAFLQGQTRSQIEKTITTQDAFNAALLKIQDQFGTLVSGGTLQKLTDVIIELTNSFAQMLNTGGPFMDLLKTDLTKEEIAAKAEKSLQNKVMQSVLDEQGISQEDYKDLVATSEATQGAFWMASQTKGQGTLGILKNSTIREARAELDRLQKLVKASSADELEKNSVITNDFILRPGQRPIKYNKDDLIMGGTSLDMPAKKDYEIDIDSFKPVLNTTLNTDSKVSEKTNMLLEKLISAVKSGGDVYIDGNKAGRAMVLGQHKLS